MAVVFPVDNHRRPKFLLKANPLNLDVTLFQESSSPVTTPASVIASLTYDEAASLMVLLAQICADHINSGKLS